MRRATPRTEHRRTRSTTAAHRLTWKRTIVDAVHADIIRYLQPIDGLGVCDMYPPPRPSPRIAPRLRGSSSRSSQPSQVHRSKPSRRAAPRSRHFTTRGSGRELSLPHFIRGCRNLTAERIEVIAANCPDLTALNVHGCYIDEPIKAIAANCPALTSLDQAHRSDVSYPSTSRSPPFPTNRSRPSPRPVPRLRRLTSKTPTKRRHDPRELSLGHNIRLADQKTCLPTASLPPIPYLPPRLLEVKYDTSSLIFISLRPVSLSAEIKL